MKATLGSAGIFVVMVTSFPMLKLKPDSQVVREAQKEKIQPRPRSPRVAAGIEKSGIGRAPSRGYDFSWCSDRRVTNVEGRVVSLR